MLAIVVQCKPTKWSRQPTPGAKPLAKLGSVVNYGEDNFRAHMQLGSPTRSSREDASRDLRDMQAANSRADLPEIVVGLYKQAQDASDSGLAKRLHELKLQEANMLAKRLDELGCRTPKRRLIRASSFVDSPSRRKPRKPEAEDAAMHPDPLVDDAFELDDMPSPAHARLAVDCQTPHMQPDLVPEEMGVGELRHVLQKPSIASKAEPSAGLS